MLLINSFISKFSCCPRSSYIDVQVIISPLCQLGSGEKFKNFESVGERLNLSAERVLLVYLLKHIDSIRYYVLHGVEASDEKIEGRILDAVNYLVLLYGIIYEKEHLNELDKELEDE